MFSRLFCGTCCCIFSKLYAKSLILVRMKQTRTSRDTSERTKVPFQLFLQPMGTIPGGERLRRYSRRTSSSSSRWILEASLILALSLSLHTRPAPSGSWVHRRSHTDKTASSHTFLPAVNDPTPRIVASLEVKEKNAFVALSLQG